MAELKLLKDGKAFIHKKAIKKIRSIDKGKSRLEIIKQLLPNYDIQDKPAKFHASTKPDKLLIGGYGSGKTYTGSAEDIFLAYVNRPLPGLIIIQSKSNSEVTTEDDLKKVCEDNHIEYWLEDDRGGTYRFFFMKFGDDEADVGKLMLASGSKPDLLKGPTVAFAHIDEPFVQPKETMEVVISRARDPKAVINEVIFTGTIEPDLQWGHEYIDDEFKGSKDMLKIVIPTTENKYAPKDYIARMRRLYGEELAKMYIDGKNVNIAGKNAYTNFTTANNVKPFEKFRFKEGVINLGIGMDFNVGKMCAAEIYLDGKVRKQIDEYITTDSNTKQLCNKIVQRLQEKYPGITGKNKFKYNILIVPDASGKARKSSADIGKTDATIIYKAFADAGFNFTLYVPPSNPLVYDRVQRINEMIAEERFLIYNNCTEAIDDRKFVKWKNTGSWELDKANGRSHMSEAADYYLYVSLNFIEANEGGNSSGVETTSRPARCR